MNKRPTRQRGASTIIVLIVLAIIGFGVYIALQYVPQYMEAGSVDSILSNLETTHNETPFKSTEQINSRLERLLNVNDMDYMADVISVYQDGDDYVVTVEYERELNLLYTKKPMPYTRTITLR